MWISKSQAERLRPYAIDVWPEVDPIHWLPLPLPRAGDRLGLRHVGRRLPARRAGLGPMVVPLYQKNAYRVLLTRARQGMVTVPSLAAKW
jgi:hypothetical protein